MFSIRTLLFISSVLLTFSTLAQTVSVKKGTCRIKNEYADGFEADLQGTSEEVEASLSKLMKTIGKTKSDDNYTSVSEPIIHEKKYAAPVYGCVKQVGNLVTAWIGIVSSDFSKKDAEELNPELEKILHDFSVNFYREKIQRQIDEAIRASQAVDRQLLRLQNQNKDLNSKIESNKREKIQLEKSLVDNKVELETLTKRLEQNKKDQDSVAVAGEQIKKIIELHKDKQRKVQ